MKMFHALFICLVSLPLCLAFFSSIANPPSSALGTLLGRKSYGSYSRINSLKNEDKNQETKQSAIAKAIEVKFDKCMKNSNVPLFRDFQTYANSLPVRMKGSTSIFRELYKYDYKVHPRD